MTRALEKAPIRQINIDNDQTNNYAIGADGAGVRESSRQNEQGLERFTTALIDELKRS